MVKTSRHFTERDFGKSRLFVASQQLCYTDYTIKLEGATVNRMIVQKQMVDNSKDVEIQFSKLLKKCVYSSLAVDESENITSSAQMCMFLRGVTSDFEMFEELVDLHSM
jgi:hypothetical protein